MSRSLTQAAALALVLALLSGGEAHAGPAPAEAEEGAAVTTTGEGAPEGEAAGKDEGVKEEWGLVTLFKTGGSVMYVLVLFSVAGLFFAVERGMNLRKPFISPEGMAQRADELWKSGKFDDIKKLGQTQPSTLGRILAFVAEHRRNALPELSTGAGEIAARDFRRHNRRAYPLAVVGTLSPLLGLMGTVFGLMESFQKVAVAGSMEDPSILADSIAKALVTTAFGLIIAVPALVAYHFFKDRTGDRLELLEEEVSGLMNNWYLKKEAA